MTDHGNLLGSADSIHPWVSEGAGKVRFGIAYGPRTDWPQVQSFVQLVESLGFDSYWTMDHPVSGFDAWSSLSALAAVTTRIRLGPLVSCVLYRSPSMHARLAADVDRISAGRLVLGLGGGNHQREFAKLGIPFDSVGRRLAAVEETVQIARGLWSDNPLTYQSDRYRLNAANVRPVPIQQPHLPLLIAGGGEKVTLRQVAQYADASNFGAHVQAGGAFSTDDVRRKLNVLQQHCLAVGRPFEAILKTQGAVPVVLAETREELATKLNAIPERIRRGYESSTVAGLPEDVAAYYQELVDAGLTYFIAGIYGDDRETVQLLADRVLPYLGANTSNLQTASDKSSN